MAEHALSGTVASSGDAEHERLLTTPADSPSRASFDDLAVAHSPDEATWDRERDGENSTLVTPTLIARRTSILDHDDQQPTAAAFAIQTAIPPSKKDDEGPVTWMSLPKKSQLAVLTLARLSEPLAERSLSAYLFFMLRSYNPDLPDSVITSQGGFLTAAFAGAQLLTAVMWGRAADSPRIGRKNVILIGLMGTCVSVVGIGFSKTFAQAMCFRMFAGALNGNVGVMRTMVSEIIDDRRYQSRAFLLLPMCFNIGVVIGPILGGFLAEPVSSLPGIFGPGSALGGEHGVGWMRRFPYALPNLVSAVFITVGVLAILLGLDETHAALKDRPDWGRHIGKALLRAISRRRDPAYAYRKLRTGDNELLETPVTPNTAANQDLQSPTPTRDGAQASTEVQSLPMEARSSNKPPAKSSFRSILQSNILYILAQHHLLAFHVSTFNTLIFLFLPSPRWSPVDKFAPARHLPFLFTGGLGLSSDKVGLAAAIIGAIGIPLQLILYPRLQGKLGTLRSYKIFLPFSAFAYIVMPFLALIPARRSNFLWPVLTVVMAAQVLSRAFVLPNTVILVNNSSPSASVLGTVHGVAQSVSSAARMLGPIIGGWVLGEGLKINCVGLIWWILAVIVGVNWLLLWKVYEGNGRGGKA